MRDLVICDKCGAATGNKASGVCDSCKLQVTVKEGSEEPEESQSEQSAADTIAGEFVWDIMFEQGDELTIEEMQGLRKDLRKKIIRYGRQVKEGSIEESNVLPEGFVEDRLNGVKNTRIFGNKLEDLNRKELMAAVVLALEQTH